MPTGIYKRTEEYKAKLKEAMNRLEVKTKLRAAALKQWGRPNARKEHSVIMRKVLANPETKAKQSAIQKVVQNYPEVREKKRSAHKGKTMGLQNGMNKPGVREKHRIACQEACNRPEVRAKKSAAQRGEKGSNWQGGITNNPYPENWYNYKGGHLKNLIRQRDNSTCQLCFKAGNCVHHIDYNKDNLKEDNLITTCRSCNAKVNFNREFWQYYFESNLAIRGLLTPNIEEFQKVS